MRTKVCTASGILLAAAAVLLILKPYPSYAQGFGGGGIPPAIKEKIQKWQRWREQHKNLDNLSTLVYQVRTMDDESGYALNKKQAAKLLSIMKSWSHKKDMSEEDARKLSKIIGDMLTLKQVQRVTTIVPPWKKRQAGGGFGGGRPAGGKPGGFSFPDPPQGGFNPLNPDTLPFPQMRPMAKKIDNAFIVKLTQQSR